MVHNRRKFALSDSSAELYDPDTNKCTIEFFAACFDQFRVAPLQHIPTPWPHTSSRCPREAQELLTSAKSDIEAILSNNSIAVDRITMQLLSPQGQFQDRVTLIIDTSDSDEPQSNESQLSRKWKVAVTQVQFLIDDEILRRNIVFKISVEIRNPQKINNKFSSAIAINSPEHHLFSSIETRVRELVGLHCPHATCISFNMRGRASEKHNLEPTIIITIKEGTRHDWLSSYLAITNTLDEIAPLESPAYAVELMPGRVVSLVDTGKYASYQGSGDLKDLKPILLQHIPEYTDIGSSISPKPIGQDGTLGPFVYFRPQGKSNAQAKACFLTCYHCVREGELNKDELQLNDFEGINIKEIGRRPPINMYAPGFLDAAATKKFCSRALQKHEDSQTSSLLSDEEVDDHKKMIEFLDENVRSNGSGAVIYASGSESTSRGGGKLDWALVELHDPSKIRRNRVVTMSELIPKLRPKYLNGLKTTSVVSKICDASVLQEWQTLYNRGRNGVTSGEFGALRSTVIREGRADTKEMSALPFAGGYLYPLAENGDSGSMVHNDAGEWVGMVIATTTSTGETHITSAQDLVAAIKEATGGDIYLS